MLGLLRIRHEDFTFVDYGCGKGRTLLLASEWRFREIVGVEFSSALCGVAERNVRAFAQCNEQHHNIRIECIDARDYELPSGPMVLYFYNPFDAAILSIVLENLARSLSPSLANVM